MDIESILAGKGREVRTIMPDATVAEAVDRMRKEGIGALVITEDGARIAGIISDRGIMNAIADHGVDVVNEPVHSVMTKGRLTCVLQDRVSAIMAAMTIRRIRHIPVVEKNGGALRHRQHRRRCQTSIGPDSARSGRNAGLHQRHSVTRLRHAARRCQWACCAQTSCAGERLAAARPSRQRSSR